MCQWINVLNCMFKHNFCTSGKKKLLRAQHYVIRLRFIIGCFSFVFVFHLDFVSALFFIFTDDATHTKMHFHFTQKHSLENVIYVLNSFAFFYLFCFSHAYCLSLVRSLTQLIIIQSNQIALLLLHTILFETQFSKLPFICWTKNTF